MCIPTTFLRSSPDLGIGRIGYDFYAVRCERLPSGVVLYSLRKWDGSEYTVSLGRNNRYRCSCPDHLYRHRTCKHVSLVVTHGMEIDPPVTECAPAEAVEAKDAYYAGVN